jgi:protein-tyrosine phosphatase
VIDLHVHIVPAVDDGPSNLAEAIALARQGVEQGIERVAATSHLRPRIVDNDWGYFEERFEELRRALDAAQIPLAMRLAAELYYEPGVERLMEDARFSLDGGGRYVLLEVSMQGEPEGAGDSFAAFARDGHVPLLAHPERVTTFLEEPERLDEYLDAGVLLQVNAGSLLGRHRTGAQALGEFLVATGRAQVVASDAHDTVQRPFALAAVRARIAELAGEERARALVEENPRRLLAGERVDVAPASVVPAEWPRLTRPDSWVSSLRKRLLGGSP